MFRRIGRQKQSAFAAELADAFRQSIRSNLIDWETMLVKGNCQTSQAMALYFHVFEETECAQAFARLMEIIETDGERMNVGVLGGRVLFHVLSAYGQSALALHMITRPDFRRMATGIARGATTLWEEFQPERDEVTSLNHHFWGNVSSWFMQTLAGIRCFSAQNPDKVCIQPFFPDGMTFAEGGIRRLRAVCLYAGSAQTHRSVCILKCRPARADGLFWRADTNLPIRERRNDRWKAEAFSQKIIKHLFRRYPGTAAGNPADNRIFRSAP